MDVMEKIDLDPASSDYAQEWIKAMNYYTIQSDGLNKDWHGNIWLNPPYSQPLILQFIKKAKQEIESGNIKQLIMLTNNSTDTEWFHLAESFAHLLCFTRGRIKFERQNKTTYSPSPRAMFFLLR